MEQVSEKVMAKLAKIKALADNAGTEGEAFTAAKMLNELLMKHKLEMTDIEYDLEVKDEPVDAYVVGGGTMYDSVKRKRVYKDYPDIEIKRKRCEWSEDLAEMIANAYGCDYLINKGFSIITFVGRKSNVAICEYMYVTMYRVIESLSWKEYKTARNRVKWEQIKGFPKAQQSKVEVDYSDLSGFRSAWIDGFVTRVGELLWEMRRREKTEEESSTALVRIKSDAIATREYLDKRFGKKKGLSSLNGSRSYNERGRAAGQAKANEVGITARGMDKGNPGSTKQIGGSN